MKNDTAILDTLRHMAWNLLTSVRRIRLMSLSVRAGKITLVRKPCKQRSHSVAVVWEKK